MKIMIILFLCTCGIFYALLAIGFVGVSLKEAVSYGYRCCRHGFALPNQPGVTAVMTALNLLTSAVGCVMASVCYICIYWLIVR